MKYKLEELIELKTQGVNTTTDNIEYVLHGHKIVQAKNIQPYNITFDDKNFVSEETYKKMKYNHKLHKGDILYTNIGSQLGNSAIYNSDEEAIITWNVMKLIPKKQIITNDFLCYLLNYYKADIVSLNSSSTMPFVSGKELMNFEFEVPSLLIQNKVTKILKTIEHKIKLNAQTNDNLYKILEQYIKEHYYNNEFVRNGNVNDIGKIQGGYAFKSKDLLNETTNNKVLKIKNISASGVDIDNTQCVYDEVANKVDKKFLLLRGNVIIAMTGAELGKTGYLYGQDYRYFLNQRVGVIRGNDKYSELYLNCLFILNDMQNTLNSKGYGSAQPNISTSDIENIEIPIPKEDELETFYEKCNPIYSKMILNSEQNQSLTQLRDTLLPKLMNGEIDLDKIEI